MTVENKQPLVTIGIPTYNRAAGHLKQALDSALNQTYANLEVVVSDNASSDGTEELVRGCGHGRIRYFRHERNIGANNNFNFCLQQANGTYFLLLHDDDMIDHDFVASCMKVVATSGPAGIVRTGTRVVGPDGTLLHDYPNQVEAGSLADFFLGWFACRTTLYLCSTLFNTAGLRQNGGFHSPTGLFQDVAAEVVLAANMGRLDIAEVKASFRRHEDNRGGGARIEDWCVDSVYLLDLMCTLVGQEDRDRVLRQGTAFFCKKNYRQVARIPSPVERFRAYWLVYRSFGFQYSPLHYLYRRKLKPPVSALRQKLRQATQATGLVRGG